MKALTILSGSDFEMGKQLFELWPQNECKGCAFTEKSSKSFKIRNQTFKRLSENSKVLVSFQALEKL